MGAGHRHTSVGTVHVKAGHAVVFEKTIELEDSDGQKHVVKNENKVVSWDDLKKVASKEELAVLEALGANLLSYEPRLDEIAKEEAAAKAEAASKEKEEGAKKEDGPKEEPAKKKGSKK
jgi:hypothetical protein